MPAESPKLKLALPKGRMEKGVNELLRDAGIDIRSGSRAYRPVLSMSEIETKILKPQNIVEMLALGSRDISFAGADWVSELGVDLVELVDTGLDPVKIVAAAPVELLTEGSLPKRQLTVATEYTRLTTSWLDRRGIAARVVRSFGATEVFPPEDADFIVDNSATGSTLKANQLQIFDEIMTSSTRLYASVEAMRCAERKPEIEKVVLLVTSVLEARKRVMIELNVAAADLERVIAVLPCMRKPTISSLFEGGGFAVKAAVPKAQVTRLIPLLKASGGTDIVVSSVNQITV
jgi:ATP phosphoribosyltransferase